MDEKGIDMIGVTISPLFYLYAGEPDIATPFALAQNDALARYCAAAPSRLFFMPTLPLQDMDASLEEVARAVTELGGKAINIGAHNVAGRELDDEYFYPLWGKCEELDIPVMLHPEPSGFIQGARALTAAEYLLDYCYQDTLAPLTMMVGGVFDHFPRLKVYCTHGGGFLPFQWRRFEIFTEDKIGSGRMGTIKMKKALRDYLPNLYLDLLIHDLPARQLAIDLVGADNVIVGDNFDGADSADGFQFVEELCLSKNDEAKIMGENAKQLLKL
jgi:aminocarboxymuconate-semialdehyde decarboxylase